MIGLFLILSGYSCSSRKDEPKVSGRIDYRISYLNEDLDEKTRDILPRSMKLIFNERLAANNIEGFLGMYRLNAITDFHHRKCSTILKVFDKYYLFRGKKNEPMCCFDPMQDMEVTETTETKTIAGFNCKKAIIYLPRQNYRYSIYFTKDIPLKNPNSNNPYKKINGVLMEFELQLLYLRMRFVAQEFRKGDQNNLPGDVPDKTIQVSREQMTQILNKLME